jgi:glyoxylase-like metal-dependent hydrolase (beta-lactamase superfamily II)
MNTSSAASRSREVRYVFDRVPDAGTAFEAAPGVYWLRMPLPFALDHINLWLLDDGDGWVIVDTGIASDVTRNAWRRLFGGIMAGKPVTRIISTHFHPDHFGLAGWLTEKTGAPLLMTRTEWLTGSLLFGDVGGTVSREQVSLFRRHGLGRDRLDALEQRGNSYRRLLSVPPAHFVRIADGEQLRIGGRDWTVKVARGHAPEHACLYCADIGVLISGDQVLPRISPNVSLSAIEPAANPLARFLESLDRLAELPADTLVLPSHGLPFHGLRERIDVLRAHHEERLRRLVSFCAAPHTAAETLDVLFPRVLDTHQVMFAMGESLSHLVFLYAAGRLQRQTGDDGIVRFRAPA